MNMSAIQSVRGMNANTLKWLANFAMLLDHMAYVFLPRESIFYFIFRCLGRIAAPVMCYFIAEGYAHTSNLKKYMGRLVLIAAISHVPYALCFGYSDIWQVWRVTSVIWSLFMGLVALTIVDRFVWKDHPILTWGVRLASVGVCCVLAYSADWNYIAVLWVVAFGVLRGSKGKQLLAFALGAVLYLAQTYANGLLLGYYFPIGVVLFLPLLFLYNGTLGKKSVVLKWAGYWFYPVHMLVIYLLAMLLS